LSMTTGLRLVSSAAQGILFDVPYPDDDEPYKFGQFGPDLFPQARCAYTSDQSVCADPEDVEVPRDIVSSMTKGLRLVSSEQQDISFDVPYPGDFMTHKSGPDLLPQPLCSDRPRFSSLEVPRHISSSKTTLMIRNIPQIYSQKELVLEWPNDSSYNFFYLPMSNDPAKGNKTFAFINFTSAQAAVAFQERWEKQRLSRFAARRTLNITRADVQGRDANMQQLQKGQLRRLKNKECQPMVFENGVQVSVEEVMARSSVCVQEQSVA